MLLFWSTKKLCAGTIETEIEPYDYSGIILICVHVHNARTHQVEMKRSCHCHFGHTTAQIARSFTAITCCDHGCSPCRFFKQCQHTCRCGFSLISATSCRTICQFHHTDHTTDHLQPNFCTPPRIHDSPTIHKSSFGFTLSTDL